MELKKKKKNHHYRKLGTESLRSCSGHRKLPRLQFIRIMFYFLPSFLPHLLPSLSFFLTHTRCEKARVRDRRVGKEAKLHFESGTPGGGGGSGPLDGCD